MKHRISFLALLLLPLPSLAHGDHERAVLDLEGLDNRAYAEMHVSWSLHVKAAASPADVSGGRSACVDEHGAPHRLV